jgi:hypothetical protein
MEYYIRNKDAGYLGNAPVWWSKGGQGYSAYLEKAERFSKEDAYKKVNMDSDKFEAFPCDLIDVKTHTVFDCQDIKSIKDEMEKNGY